MGISIWIFKIFCLCLFEVTLGYNITNSQSRIFVTQTKLWNLSLPHDHSVFIGMYLAGGLALREVVPDIYWKGGGGVGGGGGTTT